MMNRPCFWLALIPLTLASCDKKEEEQMTGAQALEALTEASVATQAQGLTAASVDLSTNFTMGQGVQAAAQELRTFVGTQLPCAEVSLEDSTLTVQYGAKPGNCTYRGHTFSGSSTLTVSRNDDESVLVEHTWDELSNGIVSVTGSAQVTWDLDAKERHVVHQARWTQIRTGRTAEGSGDRVQSLLSGGLLEGIEVNGTRQWKGEAGQWDLAIEGVQVRWIDPVPQAGRYVLSTPKQQSLELQFNRIDEDTIAVTLKGPQREFTFNVNALGVIKDA